MTKPPFKGPIDDALLALCAFSEGDLEAFRAGLDGIDTEGAGPWWYLNEGMRIGRVHVDGARLEAAGVNGWFLYFLKGDAETASIPDSCVASEEEVEDWYHSDDRWGDRAPLALSRYPAEAHAALRQEHYFGGYDADIVGLWRKDSHLYVYHAHPEGFWLLAKSPVDFVQQAATKIGR